MDFTSEVPQRMQVLVRLAALVRKRNAVETEITSIIARPAQIGHIGEYVAAEIFGIELASSASTKALDGYFRGTALAGKSVNIKWYAKHESMLDLAVNGSPDCYLVLTGPRDGVMSSKGMCRPWLIEQVFLFDAQALHGSLQARGVKLGTATSVAKALWEAAEIYPEQRNRAFVLAGNQRRMLALFGGGDGHSGEE